MTNRFLLILCIIVVSCKSKVEKNEISISLTEEETIELLLSESYQDQLGIDEQGRILLQSYYKSRNNKPLLSSKKRLNELGDTLKKLLQFPVQFGMSDLRFDLKWNENEPIQDEIVIITGLIRSWKDLRYGILDSTMAALRPHSYIPQEQLDTLLNFENISFEEKFLKWGPKDSVYEVLAKNLYQFSQSNTLSKAPIQLKPLKEDSLGTISKIENILVEKNYLNDTNKNDSTSFAKALKAFQADHGCAPDGVIGASTLKALTETNLHKAQRIALAMEKQRHTSPYPKTYFQINIPEYMLRLHNADTLCSENKIIVGTFDHQTPELKSALHTVVIYPFWNVPYSIASKEILPSLKKNTNYLTKNNMVLLKKNDTINPHNVNWSKIKENGFPYRVVQQPGPKNSLGVVKFDFHNKYDVYFHDTPSKGLFNTVARSYSHGCMRTQNPIELAKTIMELDENVMVADSIDSLLARKGQNQFIRLKKRIPVYVEYRTVIAQQDQIKLLRDVYLRDEKFLKIMFSKNPSIS